LAQSIRLDEPFFFCFETIDTLGKSELLPLSLSRIKKAEPDVPVF
jgi:hypothetical protein